MERINSVRSLVSIVVSGIFILSIGYALVQLVRATSHKQFIKDLNEQELRRSFRGLVVRSYVDSAHKALHTLSIQKADETMEFWPQYFSVPEEDIQVGDSLIKLPNSYIYQVKRGDRVIIIEGEPKK